MKRILLFLSLCWLAFVPESHAQRQLWTQGTAFTMSKGDFRLSVFHPSVYALNHSVELYAGGAYFPLAPHFYVKKKWFEKKSFAIASRHGLYYPSPLLRQVSGSGFFTSFPADSLIPNALGFQSELIFSFGYGLGTCPAFTSEPFNRNNTFKGHSGIWSFKLGLQTGLSFGDIPFPLLEEGVMYQRTAFMNQELSYYAGIDWDSRLLNYSDIKVDLDLVILPGNSWGLEHKTLVNWYHGWRFFHFLFGYHVSYFQAPSRDIFFIGPVIDFMWTFRKDKIQRGLFKEKMF